MFHNKRSIIMDFMFLEIKWHPSNIGYLLDQGQSDPGSQTLNNIVSRCEDRMYLVQVKYCVSWKSYKCRLWWCYPGLGGWKVILYCLETSNESESIMTWRMLPWYGEIRFHKMSLRKFIKLLKRNWGMKELRIIWNDQAEGRNMIWNWIMVWSGK